MGIAIVALVLSVALVAVLLTRQRDRHRPEVSPDDAPQPRRRPTRQEKILQKLDPLPEIPTLMDLVREEIAAEGIDDIPGHEDLPDPVKLKVYKRDHRVIENCPHEGYGYVVTEGIERTEATEADVELRCDDCGDRPPDDNDPPASDSPGTKPEGETFPE